MYKKLLATTFSIGAVLLFLVNALLAWVVTGPRTLELVTPYIEEALNASDGSYKVRIGSTLLSWDGWDRPIALHIKDVKIGDARNIAKMNFPDVALHFNLFKLLVGKLDIKSAELNWPAVLLSQADDGTLSFGFTPSNDLAIPTPEESSSAQNNSLAAVLALFASDSGDTPLTRLKSVSIRHARMGIWNVRSGLFFKSLDASLEIHRTKGKAVGNVTLPVEFEHNAGKVDLGFDVDGNDKSIHANLTFNGIPSPLLGELFPAQNWIRTFRMPLAGKGKLRADFEGHISSLDFGIEAGTGEVNFPEQFEKPVPIKHIRLDGELTKRLSSMNLRAGSIDFGRFALNFGGDFHREGDDYAIEAKIHTEHVPINDLHLYWPKSLSPHTRSWVIERISEGEVQKSDVALHFKPGELKLKNTPRSAVDATLDIAGANVLYMPKSPPVKGVRGRIVFTGDSMEASVSEASYLSGSKITKAALYFPDLNAADVKLFVDMDVTAPAHDVQVFLDLPTLNKAKKLGLTPEIKGKASGNAKLDLIAFSEHEELNKEIPDINYDLKARLENVTQPQFLDKYDVSEADMKVEVNNAGLKATGNAKINELPMSITAESKFNDAHDTTYAIKTNMPMKRMPDFGLPKLEWTTGNMDVDAVFTSSDVKDESKAKLNLLNTAINLPEHGYTKGEGEKAMLEIETSHMESGNTAIPYFRLAGDGYAATGSAEIDRNTGDFQHITFDRMTVGKHDLELLEYEKTPTGIRVKAEGAVFDLSPYMDNLNKGGKPIGLEADLKVDRLIIRNKKELYGVTLQADCPDICNTASVEASLQDKTPFTYSIQKGQLDASCDNAGLLLKTLDVYEGMQGGKLSLKGQYQGKKIVGKATIRQFTVKNAPILTKIFTIASLTGILNTLSGNGIEFDKLQAPYEYNQGEIAIKDAKQYGSAIGLTASGNISLPKSIYDLSGTLVPSYTINSLVGKIPLLGNIIVGGEGKGLIALNYSVKGPMADPSISANPLSVLTPGFLRGIFDIFDKPAPDIKSLEKATKVQEKPKP